MPIEFTAKPNILKVTIKDVLDIRAQEKFGLFRSDVVVYLEVSRDAIRLWYSHHEFWSRQSPESEWKLSGQYVMKLEDGLAGLILYKSMVEFWTHFCTPLQVGRVADWLESQLGGVAHRGDGPCRPGSLLEGTEEGAGAETGEEAKK